MSCDTAVIASRPTKIEVSLEALSANFNLVKAAASRSKIMCVVKANAYGHGLVACAKHFESLGADYLGVAFVEEGVQLRESGVRIPILVLGGMLEGQIESYLNYNLDIVGLSVGKLGWIDQASRRLGKRARVHLKIDTGMQRIGQQHGTARQLFEAAAAAKGTEIVGLMSHLATADSDQGFMQIQIQRFKEVCGIFDAVVGAPVIRHLANSAAVFSSSETHFDMIRPGLALYGVSPFAKVDSRAPSLRSAMTLRSRIVYFKVVKKGEGVSYGHSWRAPCDTRIVTIPLGYGDGFHRALSNVGKVLIRGRRYPIVGKICMDQMMVDLGQDGVGYNGDVVTVIGCDGEQEVSVSEVAELGGTISYEVLVSLNERIPRVYL